MIHNEHSKKLQKKILIYLIKRQKIIKKYTTKRIFSRIFTQKNTNQINEINEINTSVMYLFTG